MNKPIAALEVGGTHSRAGMVDTGQWRVYAASVASVGLDASASSDVLAASIVQPLVGLPIFGDSLLGVGIPGPFDYRRGMGSFEGVAKFESLRGLDLRDHIAATVSLRPEHISFINDANAFGIGEWLSGAGRNHQRMIALTLGTGVGSVFLQDGTPVEDGPDVPPEGRVDLLRIEGRPLEEVFSRRAIRLAYQGARGDLLDVKEIAERARSGDSQAHRVLVEAAVDLGRSISPYVGRFEPTVVVVGGAIARSWDVLSPALEVGLDSEVPIVRAALEADASLIGAAHHASNVAR